MHMSLLPSGDLGYHSGSPLKGIETLWGCGKAEPELPGGPDG